MRIVGGKIEVRVPKIPWPFPESVHAVTIWPLIFYEPPRPGVSPLEGVRRPVPPAVTFLI